MSEQPDRCARLTVSDPDELERVATIPGTTFEVTGFCVANSIDWGGGLYGPLTCANTANVLTAIGLVPGGYDIEVVALIPFAATLAAAEAAAVSMVAD